MQMADRGRVVEGARADLLIVNGDPEQDITAASEPVNHRAVLKEGRFVKGAELVTKGG